MPNLGFWNLDGRVKSQDVVAFAHESDLDLIVLAENGNSDASLNEALNPGRNSRENSYFRDMGNSEHLTIFTRFQTQRGCLLHDSPGISIRHYEFPVGESFSVVAVHLPSKLWDKTEDQALGSTRIARYIRDAEIRAGHLRTIAIGDFNMNPFEHGLVAAEGFHAVMDRRVAAAGYRERYGERRELFLQSHLGLPRRSRRYSSRHILLQLGRRNLLLLEFVRSSAGQTFSHAVSAKRFSGDLDAFGRSVSLERERSTGQGRLFRPFADRVSNG